MNGSIFIPIIIVAAISFMVLLNWYRNKELRELKAGEYKILAAENNLFHSEDGGSLYSRLKAQGMLTGNSRPKIDNVLTQHLDGYTTHIFDASHVIQQQNSKKRIHFIGLAVDFDNLSQPRFDLKQSTLFEGVTFLSDMLKIKKDQQPKWLDPAFSLFYSRWDSSEQLLQFISDKQALNNHINRNSFHLLASSRKTFVFYFAGELQPTAGLYKRLEDRVRRLAFIMDPSLSDANTSNPKDDIQQLKRKVNSKL